MKKSYKVQSFYLNSEIVYYQFIFHNKIIVNYIENIFYIIENINHKCFSRLSIQHILNLFCNNDAILYDSTEYFIRTLENKPKEKYWSKEFKKRRDAKI